MKRFRTVQVSTGWFLLFALLHNPACGISFTWSFTNSAGGNTSGPVTGTIGFSTLTAGAGGTHIADSFTIDSAPGHVISNGYTLGDEIFGSGLWDDISNDPDFTFTTTNLATSGDLAFKDLSFGILLIDFRPPSLNSFFRSPGSPHQISQGSATWTVIIPEPSSGILALLLLQLSVCMCRDLSGSRSKVTGP